MKSLSATKYNPIKVLNNSFNTPDKKLHKVCFLVISE